jgi:hypothetical protein
MIEALLIAQYLALAVCLGISDPPAPPTLVYRPAPYIQRDGRKFRGYLYRGKAVVALDEDNGSTTLHEFVHHLLKYRDGDADAKHRRRAAWACVPEVNAQP